MPWGKGAPAETNYDPDFIDGDTRSSGFTFRVLGGMAATLLAILFAMILRPALKPQILEDLRNMERDH